MNRRSDSRDHAEHGTTLVEVVVGLFLVALAAGVLAQLMTSAARSTPADDGAPDVSLALDAWSRDVREADHVVALVDGVRLETTTQTIDWTTEAGDLRRDDGTTERTMVTAIDATDTFTLVGADGRILDGTEPDIVRWCTRLLRIDLTGDDWAATRETALRITPGEGACP